MRSAAASLLLVALVCGCCTLGWAQAQMVTPSNNTDFLAGFKGPFPTIDGYAGTEISSTVSLLYQNDWDVQYVGRTAEDWNSRCIDMLYRATEFKAKVVNFMITHYWVDNDFNGEVSPNCLNDYPVLTHHNGCAGRQQVPARDWQCPTTDIWHVGCGRRNLCIVRLLGLGMTWTDICGCHDCADIRRWTTTATRSAGGMVGAHFAAWKMCWLCML
jgi:hypothetical protein